MPRSITNSCIFSSLPLFLFVPQFVTRASSTVRAGLKEPARSKAMAQESFTYNTSKWSAGDQGEKVAVDALGKAGL